MYHDKIALSLEKRKLWRRASTRWLEVYRNLYLTEDELDWVIRRSKFCLEKAARPYSEAQEPTFPGVYANPSFLSEAKFHRWG